MSEVTQRFNQADHGVTGHRSNKELTPPILKIARTELNQIVHMVARLMVASSVGCVEELIGSAGLIIPTNLVDSR